jgi:hypothetical protein
MVYIFLCEVNLLLENKKKENLIHQIEIKIKKKKLIKKNIINMNRKYF